MQAINTVQPPVPNNLYSSHGKALNGGAERFVPCIDLRWSARCDQGMGRFKSSIMTRQVLSHVVRKHLRTAVHVRAAFTSKQEALVKDTWAILKKDAAHHGMALFLTVFEIAPAAKKLFSFLKDSDVPLAKNAKLKKHALQVFVIICEAASSLSQKGQVLTPGSTMKDMAHAHVISGVVDEHYDVVRYSLLKTVQAGIPPEMWNEEVKNAWGDAYDELVLAIKAQEEYAVPA
ncbi:hypothetical protein GOP47_0021712 [Adiantum capillus-veneris]|uniref:Globin domain-containing protein n=1 Tax=Adiantum capillus-veneris TaxID=13818 RepID=A0A9D4U8M9_ADICA|nr:hypothetical protein GOP47_0021712 [Adiantum capillus-veneris]